MWIKICANTNLEDALLACELGADAVGFVFAPSKRRVTAAQVADITPHLPSQIERIGVFPETPASEIIEIVSHTGLTGVQLHTRPDAAFIEQLRAALDPKVEIIQTVHWPIDAENDNASSVELQLNEIATAGVVSRVLIDSKIGTATGGTGISFDWTAAQRVFQRFADKLQLIAAGGLNPDNVQAAIHQLQPWGIDVASGVESAPGSKSPARLKEFLSRAHSGGR